jgi:hypothetical protein
MTAPRDRAGELAAFYTRHQRNLERIVSNQVRASGTIVEDACQTAWTSLCAHPEVDVLCHERTRPGSAARMIAMRRTRARGLRSGGASFRGEAVVRCRRRRTPQSSPKDFSAARPRWSRSDHPGACDEPAISWTQ